MAAPVKPWQKRLIYTMTLLLTSLALLSICIVTPIFAGVGGWLLDVFSKSTLPAPQSPPAVIVVLGGGLTKHNDQNNPITLNHFSQSRADAAITLYQTSTLPIITSGVESPWLRDYLKQQLPNALIISDNASMNTCENAIFTAKLLKHHELPNSVYLVTDHYHIARAGRQFAKAGLFITAYSAPLAIAPSWTSPHDNLVHSRRTFYEIMALGRDIFSPQSNCRADTQITLEEISTPRRQAKIF